MVKLRRFHFTTRGTCCSDVYVPIRTFINRPTRWSTTVNFFYLPSDVCELFPETLLLKNIFLRFFTYFSSKCLKNFSKPWGCFTIIIILKNPLVVLIIIYIPIPKVFRDLLPICHQSCQNVDQIQTSKSVAAQKVKLFWQCMGMRITLILNLLCKNV